MLHFGKKYEMKEMRQEAIQCLKTEFPSTLHHWSKHIFGHVIEGVGSQEIPTTSLFEILYLAHEHSVTSILPALYLHICLTHNAVSRVLLFEFHLNLYTIVRTTSPRALKVSQRNRLAITIGC